MTTKAVAESELWKTTLLMNTKDFLVDVMVLQTTTVVDNTVDPITITTIIVDLPLTEDILVIMKVIVVAVIVKEMLTIDALDRQR